jgi:hypothetical protein
VVNVRTWGGQPVREPAPNAISAEPLPGGAKRYSFALTFDGPGVYRVLYYVHQNLMDE